MTYNNHTNNLLDKHKYLSQSLSLLISNKVKMVDQILILKETNTMKYVLDQELYRKKEELLDVQKHINSLKEKISKIRSDISSIQKRKSQFK